MTSRPPPPTVIEFRGSDPSPNSLLLVGLRPDPAGPRTVAETLALLAETRMNVAAKRAAAPVAKERVCHECRGLPVRYVARGCGHEPVRCEREDAEECRACGEVAS